MGGDVSVFLDMAKPVGDDRNYFLVGEHGGFGLLWSAPGIYEIHTFILPEGRGKWAYLAAGEMLDYMGFSEKLWTRVEPKDRNVRWFTMKFGFTRVGGYIEDFGGGPVEYDFFEKVMECQ